METKNETHVDATEIEGVGEDPISPEESMADPDLSPESTEVGVDTSQVRLDSIQRTSPEEPGHADSEENVAEETDEQIDSDNVTEMDAGDGELAGEQIAEDGDDDFDALLALTKLLVGGAIEGTSQLTKRLRYYEEELRRAAEERATEGLESAETEEDELTRLRYAVVGLIFDAQASLRKNITLWAKLADQSVRVTNQISQPVASSFLFRPFTRRYEKMVRRGEARLARWIAEGRREEEPSRDLALMTYEQIVGEFIDRLAENPELQAVITKQSISVAGDMRDEVRERTVTADNLIEGLVRRILRRTPRAELPGPPPQVQRWAGLTLEEYRSLKLQSDEGTDEQSP